jgi:hypothetical protein
VTLEFILSSTANGKISFVTSAPGDLPRLRLSLLAALVTQVVGALPQPQQSEKKKLNLICNFLFLAILEISLNF